MKSTVDLRLGCGYGDTYNFSPEHGRKKLAFNTRKEKGWSNHHEKIAQSCEHAVIFGDNCDNCSSVTYGRDHFRNLSKILILLCTRVHRGPTMHCIL